MDPVEKAFAAAAAAAAADDGLSFTPCSAPAEATEAATDVLAPERRPPITGGDRDLVLPPRRLVVVRGAPVPPSMADPDEFDEGALIAIGMIADSLASLFPKLIGDRPMLRFTILIGLGFALLNVASVGMPFLSYDSTSKFKPETSKQIRAM